MRFKELFIFLVLFSLASHLIVYATEDGTENKVSVENHKPEEVDTMLSKRFDEGNIVVQLVNSLTQLASNGFRSGFEASVRSLFKKPMTSAVYALSMLVGVVAMLAFYESPISPLPVPSLPDPPVGRFPPEHPVWPPTNDQPAPIPRFNPKGDGLAQFPMNGAAASQQYYNFVPNPSENKRSDGRIYDRTLFMRPKFSQPAQMNETSYNNYISKLTSSFNSNGNNNAALGKNGLDVNNNRVLDYNSKRLAVELLKHQTANPENNLTSA